MVTPPMPVVNDCWAVVGDPAVVGGTEEGGIEEGGIEEGCIEEGGTEEVGAPLDVGAMEPLAEADAAPQPSGPAMLSSLQSYQL